MSQKAVTRIIGRALAEPKFRRLLETDLNKALAGFDLTQDEVNLIRSSLLAGADPAASELESRVSRAGLPLDLLSGLTDSLSAQADGIPTSSPSFGTVGSGGKEGAGSLGSGPTGGGIGASQGFPGAGTSDLGHGVVGTGPHEWGSGSSEPGQGEIPEPEGAVTNLGPDIGPDLLEGEAGSAPAGGAELGEGEMPQGVLPSGVDDHSGEGDETGVTNTMGEDDESGAIDIHGEAGGGPDAAETGGKGTGLGGETGATETGPDYGASEVEGGKGPAQPAGAEMGGGDEGGVVDIHGEGGRSPEQPRPARAASDPAPRPAQLRPALASTPAAQTKPREAWVPPSPPELNWAAAMRAASSTSTARVAARPAQSMRAAAIWALAARLAQPRPALVLTLAEQTKPREAWVLPSPAEGEMGAGDGGPTGETGAVDGGGGDDSGDLRRDCQRRRRRGCWPR